jgi:hypothetical protein
MKNFTLLMLIASAFINMNAQCKKTVSTFVRTPSYSVKKGSIDVTIDKTGKTLTAYISSDFDTQPGPDVNLYLLDPGTNTDEKLVSMRLTGFNNSGKILFGNISKDSPAVQNKTFTVKVPDGIDITKYTKVFMFCNSANQTWSFGTVTPFTSFNCGTLSLGDEATKNSFRAYPNPVTNTLNLDLDNYDNNLSVNIYNTLGSLILSKRNLTAATNKINVSNFDKGIYFVEIKDKDNKSVVKRFVKSN